MRVETKLSHYNEFCCVYIELKYSKNDAKNFDNNPTKDNLQGLVENEEKRKKKKRNNKERFFYFLSRKFCELIRK